MTGVVNYERSEHVLVITINRPEARNAVNGDVAAGIEEAIDHLESNHDLWIGILTGTPPAFSAGADLKEIAAGNASKLSTKRGGFAGLVYRNRTKPLIAAVDGPALAGGCEIALSCDLIVASRSAVFGVPEVKRSLVAGAGGLFRLASRLPMNVATELILTGDPISAEDAHRYGLVNRLCETNKALDSAHELASRIASNAPVAVWESLGVIHAVDRHRDEQLFKASGAAMMSVMQTEDFKEGPRAFIEKRAPIWSGR